MITKLWSFTMGLSSQQVPCYAITVYVDTFHVTGLVEWSCYRSRYALGKERRCENTPLALDASQTTDIVCECIHLAGLYDDSLACERPDEEDDEHEPLLRRWRFRLAVYVLADRSRLYECSVYPTLPCAEARSAQLRAIAEVDSVCLWRITRERTVDYIHTVMDKIVDVAFDGL